MDLSDKVRLFRSVFKGREDIVPRYWISKDGGRSGYSPLCRNEWKEGICQKPCRNCLNSDYIPLSDDLVIDHFKGRHILGVYPLLQDNSCNFIVADFDDHHGIVGKSLLDDVKSFHEVCWVQGIPCHVLRSKSGRGYHVYSFFDYPVPAWKARVVYFAFLEEAQLLDTDGYGVRDKVTDDITDDVADDVADEGSIDQTSSSGFDRLFPNQDHLSGGG